MARTIADVKEELKTIQNDLANFENSGRNIDPVRLSVRERIFRGDTIRSTDNLGLLLKKEYELEKEQNELLFTEELIQQGRDPKSERFQHDLNLKLLKKDLEIFNPQQIDNYRKDVRQKILSGDTILQMDAAGQLLQREFQEEREVRRIGLEESLQRMGFLKDSPIYQKTLELKLLQSDMAGIDKRNLTPEKRKSLDDKELQLAAEIDVLAEEEASKVVAGELQDKKKKEAKKEIQKETQKETQKTTRKVAPKRSSVTETNRTERRKKQEEERKHQYAVEFAAKELTPEIRGCGDPIKLAQYLTEAAANPNLSPEAREHLEQRALANAKIMSLEQSRTISQKKRPAAVRYIDGTILLKNKRRDVPKQTSTNGCWSAVMSDMLNHFGVELSQEEIRAYRPDINPTANPKDVEQLMNRLNTDAMNEINDMADLIQRTVPNVAHHHMSLGANKEENKAILKEKVSDALLHKNSPVAVLYDNHYMSIVGIKGDTLIVQNPSPEYDTKYQKLSIDDLFAGCMDTGQVCIDWLESLKFEKNGKCKNVTEQWKNMGINCTGRKFAAGPDENHMTHVRGNEYHDTSRLEQGIEETIYLPKMSFGLEKELENIELSQQRLESARKGIMSYQQAKQEEIAKDDTEFLENGQPDPEFEEMNLEELTGLH